jgi:hypothetical protein
MTSLESVVYRNVSGNVSESTSVWNLYFDVKFICVNESEVKNSDMLHYFFLKSSFLDLVHLLLIRNFLQMSCCSPICGALCPLTFFVNWSQTSTGKS